MSRIWIMGNQPHRGSGTEVWACQHHGLASAAGIVYQSQHLERRVTRSMNMGEETKENSSKVLDGAVISDEHGTSGGTKTDKEGRLRRAKLLKEDLLRKLEEEKEVVNVEELSKKIIS